MYYTTPMVIPLSWINLLLKKDLSRWTSFLLSFPFCPVFQGIHAGNTASTQMGSSTYVPLFCSCHTSHCLALGLMMNYGWWCYSLLLSPPPPLLSSFLSVGAVFANTLAAEAVFLHYFLSCLFNLLLKANLCNQSLFFLHPPPPPLTTFFSYLSCKHSGSLLGKLWQTLKQPITELSEYMHNVPQLDYFSPQKCKEGL